MRKTSEELEKIKKKYKVDQIWSWSRYHTYKTSKYEYYLKYVAKIQEDRNDSIYSFSGNTCHNIMEEFYTNKIKYEDMISQYESELDMFNLAELKYDRSNADKNAVIAKKYEECIRHFFRHHNVMTRKVDLERFIVVKIGEYLFQGYIDCIHREGDIFVITDFKTSSIYKGKKIDSEKGQLVLYAEALRQLGVPLENIKIRWNFLKYVTVEQQQANGKITSREIARNEIGSSLKANVTMWLKKTKRYTEQEIEDYVNMLVSTNSIEFLPDDIKAKYIFDDCHVEIPFNEIEIKTLKSDIISTLTEINRKEVEYAKTKSDKIWWEEVSDYNSYYFANLSGYSARLHKPYGEYLDKINANKNNNSKEDEDLSWMLDL